MAAPRLSADLWVSAYLRHLQLAGIPVYVTCRGDATAGAVHVKLATLDGRACIFGRSFDLMTDRRSWQPMFDGPEPEADAWLSRARARDPDLWVVEIEDRAGRHLLDTPGLCDG